MATPLERDGYRVNTAVLPQLVEFLLGAGAKGLFVGGTTGEGILLDISERMRLHEATIAAAAGRNRAKAEIRQTEVATTAWLPTRYLLRHAP